MFRARDEELPRGAADEPKADAELVAPEPMAPARGGRVEAPPGGPTSFARRSAGRARCRARQSECRKLRHHGIRNTFDRIRRIDCPNAGRRRGVLIGVKMLKTGREKPR